MAGAGAIRAGGAYVEIFARDGAFQQAMARVESRMRAVATTMQRIGTGMFLGGAALGAPLLLAARQASAFEDAILGMQAAAGLSQAEVKALADEAKRLSVAMGIAPEKLAQAFLELAKAGMSVKDILAGAGKSAAEFSRVSGVDAERAAVFMKAAMNVFGISAAEAVDTLSAAADSSETSIAQMIESFSQVGSAGQAFNQSLFGIAQAMAALAQGNIMGEEAGTAIKTMLTKLVAPTDDAKEALAELGLTIADFRDADGKLLPLSQIAGVFERAIGGMDGSARELILSQKALVDVFEQRGIKVITQFANVGEKGFRDIEKQMMDALPVSAKFTIVMSGITGNLEKLSAAAKRVSIAFGEAISGPMGRVTAVLTRLMDEVAALIARFPQLAVVTASVVAGMVALGAALIVAGVALKGLAVAFGALASPIGLATAAVVAFAWHMTNGFQDLELWGMRIQAAWKKVAIYVASAFDRDVAANMNQMIQDIDDDLAKWTLKYEQEKERRANAPPPPPPRNDIKPDVFREPLGGGDPFASAPEPRISSAGTFGSGEGLGIGPELNKLEKPLARIVANGEQQLQEMKKLGAAAQALVDRWKNNPREPNGEFVDLRDPAALARWNAQTPEFKPQFREDLPWNASREWFESLPSREPDAPPMTLQDAVNALRSTSATRASTGTEVSDTPDMRSERAPVPGLKNEILSSPPELVDWFDPMVADAADAVRMQRSGDFLLDWQRLRAFREYRKNPFGDRDLFEFYGGKRFDFLYDLLRQGEFSGGGPSPGVDLRKTVPAPNAGAAVSAAAGTQLAQSVQQLPQAFRVGFDAVAASTAETTAAVKENTKILDRMVGKLDNLRLAYS